MTDVRYADALSALETLVETRGEDFVYEPPGGGLRCLYADGHQGCASCGIGWVLENVWNVPVSTLATLDELSTMGVTPGHRMFQGILFGEAGLRFSLRAIGALGTFQRCQDNRGNYGRCLQVVKDSDKANREARYGSDEIVPL